MRLFVKSGETEIEYCDDNNEIGRKTTKQATIRFSDQAELVYEMLDKMCQQVINIQNPKTNEV